MDCIKSEKYWNSVKKNFFNQYSLGYLIPEEKIARYRFEKELFFLSNEGVFGGSYLDLGCGTGNFLFEWKDKFDHLIGIDFSKIMIEFAEKRCTGVKNIIFYKGNVKKFKKYTQNISNFSFVFIGGCLMYLNDADVVSLFKELLPLLKKGGKIIFRESVARKKRILENDKYYTCIRRTVKEYMKLMPSREEYVIDSRPNYAYNYAMEISLYWKIFPFLKNNIDIFKNFLVELLFLFIPLKIYDFMQGNTMLNYFFVIKKKNG